MAAVAFLGDQLYALLAGGGCSHGNATPSAVIRIDRKRGTAEVVANLSSFFREHPVAHPEPDDFEPDGTAYALRPFHGDLIVLEPNHGRLLRINLSGKHDPRIKQLTDFSAPLGHQVPTSLASRDGRFYVGNLFHFPIVGSSKPYQVTRDGFVVDYWGGFTTLVGVEVDEGRLYVLELSSADGFPDIGKGRILRITGQVVEEIVTSLSVPTAMTFDSHGNIYVSDLGAAPPGAGRILQFANPISGRVITTVEVRPPAPIGDESEGRTRRTLAMSTASGNFSGATVSPKFHPRRKWRDSSSVSD